MVPHFKFYLNYSQRNSNLKLGLQLETLTIGVGPSVKMSILYSLMVINSLSVTSQIFCNPGYPVEKISPELSQWVPRHKKSQRCCHGIDCIKTIWLNSI